VLSFLEAARQFFDLLAGGVQPAVVFLSSTMGMVGAGGMVAYSASKGAVSNLTRSLAVEWAPRKIRVNAVAPGVVPSPMVTRMFAGLEETQVREIQQRHPLGFGEPADVAEAVSFLVSPEAKWITGVVLPVDGGYTAQ
jgi:NAD(P)-dependent dehydrogenase (short-subunit alcohol dehydrogenase family)